MMVVVNVTASHLDNNECLIQNISRHHDSIVLQMNTFKKKKKKLHEYKCVKYSVIAHEAGYTLDRLPAMRIFSPVDGF